jgi:hypothetical protein
MLYLLQLNGKRQRNALEHLLQRQRLGTHPFTGGDRGQGLAFKFYNTEQVLREALIGRKEANKEQIYLGPRGCDGAQNLFS